MSSETSQFCRYCGSSSIVDVEINLQTGSSRFFNPTVSIQTPAASITPSLGALGHSHGSSMTYITKYCSTCRNRDVLTTLDPLNIRHTDGTKSIVFPYTLLLHLRAKNLTELNIQDLANRCEESFDKYYNKWSKKGVNPCKKDRVGKYFTLDLGNLPLDCWLIIDHEREMIMYRICYGGMKINCH